MLSIQHHTKIHKVQQHIIVAGRTTCSSLNELSYLGLIWLQVPGFCQSEPFCTSRTWTWAQRAVQWNGGWMGMWCSVLLYLQCVWWPYDCALREWVWGDLLSSQQCWLFVWVWPGLWQRACWRNRWNSRMISWTILWYNIRRRWRVTLSCLSLWMADSLGWLLFLNVLYDWDILSCQPFQLFHYW